MSATFPHRVALVAHQGGWDEILLVAGPIVVIVAVLAVAKRRVDASFERRVETGHDTSHGGSQGDPIDPPTRSEP